MSAVGIVGGCAASRRFAAIFAEKCHEPEAEHVEGGDECGDDSNQPIGPACLIGAPQDFIFAEETCQAWDSRDCQGGGCHRPKAPGELGAKAAHASHVLLAADCVNNGTGCEEEQAFEEGM